MGREGGGGGGRGKGGQEGVLLCGDWVGGGEMAAALGTGVTLQVDLFWGLVWWVMSACWWNVVVFSVCRARVRVVYGQPYLMYSDMKVV